MVFEKDFKILKSDMKELPEEISRNKLIDWFLEKQKSKNSYCTSVTVAEIIIVADICNIKVIR